MAERLGMTVRQLGEAMGADELMEWIAFLNIQAGTEYTVARGPTQLMG